MTPDDITIAVTVFDRRSYIEQAVASALAQTVPVRVIVVEDCGPDAGLQSFVLQKFGPRITYHRNAARRGLFDNWNACIELCRTPWLCLLHDDDYLEPLFVETMVELANKRPGKGLYYGLCRAVNANGKEMWKPPAPFDAESWSLDSAKAALGNPILFPGEIFRADYVKSLGGFLSTSQFTGDWDMWLKLTQDYGAAGVSRIVGNARDHFAEGRGTIRVVRNGKFCAYNIMQAKKNLAFLRRRGIRAAFSRAKYLDQNPVPVRYMLARASGLSPRMLSYNWGLLVHSRPTCLRDSFFLQLARCLGPRFLAGLSFLYNRLSGKVSRRMS
jgi:glycosyltransferase involved in cell wall biosynthesis